MKEFNLPPLVSSVYGKPKDNEIFAVLLHVPKQIISGDILSDNTDATRAAKKSVFFLLQKR